ncbi:MAG: hypothetical protein CSB55_03655 [Candidatus Cloacimonadota bacterium]|nr:MAG: hypothetical protein CSB55_03655 [Candidatus Cloacimonadota bacterium]
MNYRTLIWISLLIFVSSLNSIGIKSDFEVKFEPQRFFTEEGYTLFETSYKIPYSQLEFTRMDYGYQADIKTDKYLLVKGEWRLLETFTEHVVTKNEVWTKSYEKSYKDIVSLTLSKGEYRLKLIITDINSGKYAEFEKDLNLLNKDDIISDIEINAVFKPDTSNYLRRFQRNGFLFDRAYGHIIPANSDIIYFTFNINPDKKNNDFIYNIEVKNNNQTIISENIEAENLNDLRIISLPATNFKSGAYTVILNVTEKGIFVVNSKNFFFIQEKKNHRPYLFTEIEDEIKLIKYLLNSKEKRKLNRLSKEGKENYLENFWTINNPDPNSGKNVFFEEIKARKDYANKFYSHFQKGWKSDRGRILIRNGKPDREQDFAMSDVIGDFKIWEYDNLNCVYLFYDRNTSGKFKLYYSSNDEINPGNHNWKNILGHVNSIDELTEKMKETGSAITRY